MLLSIIVPVYNVEQYINRCVDSLLDQGAFDDYEIILVDDGSTDTSGDICDIYAKKHNRIRVIHKKNGGLSSARNVGINEARGEYLMFVDSDDYIKTDVLECLFQYVNNEQLDILIFNFAHIYGKYNIVNNEAFLKDYQDVVTGSQYMADNLEAGTMHMMACNKLYKRSLIVDNNVFFREGYVHEDEEWSPRLIIHADRVKQVDFIVYGYCIRSDSISSYENKRKAALDLFDNCKELLVFSSSVADDTLRDQLENNIATLCLSAYYKGRLTDKSSEIISSIENINPIGKNLKKYKLLKFNPKLYLLVNDCAKSLARFKAGCISLLHKPIAVKNILSDKVRKKCRMCFVAKKQQKELKNHHFSIISSSCNGGVITSELGEQFRTPTINLWFTAKDYIKLASDLKHYMSKDVLEVKNCFHNYPVGRVDDITVYFMHYHSFEEARNKWNERKERINYDNLFFMMAEKDGCTKDKVREFDSLPYNNKVVFTYNSFPECSSAICVKDCSPNGETAIMTDFVGLTGRKYDKYFDYVKWLNEGDT